MTTNVKCDKQPGIPNISKGTECGRIVSPDSSLIGRRVVLDDAFGTVCYVGGLPKSKGTWLGVDWDNDSRGRHNGTYDGVRYFLTKFATSGSFVRPEKVSLGTSLEEAFVYRYVLCAECQLAAQNLSCSEVVDNSLQPLNCFFSSTDVPGRINYFTGDAEEEAEYSGRGNDLAQPLRIELFTGPASSSKGSKNTASDRHENCGPSGARTTLKNLKSASFTLVPVFRALHGEPNPEKVHLWPAPGGTLGDLLPRLEILEINACLSSRWVEVAQACVQMPRLRSLNVSSNRLRLPLSPSKSEELTNSPHSEADLRKLRMLYDLDADPARSDELFHKAFPHLCQLVLVRSELLDWASLTKIILWTPSLKSLSVAYNKLGDIPDDLSTDVIRVLQGLVELDLTATEMTNLNKLFGIIGPSVILETLLLDRNKISFFPTLPLCSNVDQDNRTTDVGQANLMVDSPFVQSEWFSNVSTLSLRQTDLADWKVITELLRLPKLKSLMFCECPLLDNITPQTAHQEIVARLPALVFLNRLEITGDDRRGAELDYLKRYGAVWRSTGGDVVGDTIKVDPKFAAEHPVFLRLCNKFGPPDVGESKLFTHTLKEGLVKIRFVLQSNQQSTTPLKDARDESCVSAGIIRRIPGRMTVGHIRTIVRRLFKLPVRSNFNLVVQGERHKKINAEIPLDADTRELGYYNLEDEDVIYVRLVS
ncbi:unnamed protein product [Calicophoron daubneyi]|uniref:Tubulin-specific chaperone E n=1 Tax=Calicophoron daubneyi TaxID=300641 RepID=A0AAV2U2F7_CALDB